VGIKGKPNVQFLKKLILTCDFGNYGLILNTLRKTGPKILLQSRYNFQFLRYSNLREKKIVFCGKGVAFKHPILGFQIHSSGSNNCMCEVLLCRYSSTRDLDPQHYNLHSGQPSTLKFQGICSLCFCRMSKDNPHVKFLSPCLDADRGLGVVDDFSGLLRPEGGLGLLQRYRES
jgi:hypothetical protein